MPLINAILSQLSIMLINLIDAIGLAVTLAVLLHVLARLVPVFDWDLLKKDRKFALTLMILAIILYMLPGVIRQIFVAGA